MDKINITQQSPLGLVWFAGWLFTLGFLKLGFWKAIWAILVWPYFIGSYFSGLAG